MTEETETTTLMGFATKIAPELEEYRRPLTDFQTHPDNFRKHKIERIAKSLEDHGQRSLIIVQKSTRYIVKGNGTYTAMQMLGWTEGAFSEQEMTDEAALAYLSADNKASDEATYDRKKLREGLAKMAAGPGLWDSGWSVDEFEDLDEELTGTTVLDPVESGAAFATKDGETLAKSEGTKLPGEKMREVPLVLTIADHAMFVERIRLLQKRFGTGGTIATIIEAVRRQSDAETDATPVTGKALTADEVYAVKRALVKEVRDYIIALGKPDIATATLTAMLEKLAPYRAEPTPVAAGQVGAFEELVGEGQTAEFDTTPVLASPVDDAEQQAALTRYRASQAKR